MIYAPKVQEASSVCSRARKGEIAFFLVNDSSELVLRRAYSVHGLLSRPRHPVALRRQRRARIVRLPTLAALVVVLALASATHLVAATAVAEDVLADAVKTSVSAAFDKREGMSCFDRTPLEPFGPFGCESPAARSAHLGDAFWQTLH